MKTRLLIGGLLATSLTLSAQIFTEKIARELAFEKKGNNALMIFNVNGSVKVESYTGDKILVEVEKTISAKTEARLAEGKEEIQLGVMDRADTVMLYVKGICSEFGKQEPKSKRGKRQSKWNGWGYMWSDWGRGRTTSNDRDCEKRYDYNMSFVIKVPSGISVLASTINGGDIEISGISKYVLADNVNGSIRLTNISGPTNASTINGSVDLDYSCNPSGDSRYYSLNGDINANFRKGLGAQLTFKSFNGDFYSSVDDITPMAVMVEKYDKGDGIHYKVNGNRYRVRQGGPLLDFETFNGDVYLKEKEN